MAITLTGEGEKRSLSPLGKEVGDLIERYRAGEDYASNSLFSFFGLPKGEYELTITAEGCQPYKATYHVVPGEYGSYKPIDMIPLKPPSPKGSEGLGGHEKIRLRE